MHRLTERVIKVYLAEAKRTGSYVIARQIVMARYGITERRLDQMLRLQGRA